MLLDLSRDNWECRDKGQFWQLRQPAWLLARLLSSLFPTSPVFRKLLLQPQPGLVQVEWSRAQGSWELSVGWILTCQV